MAFILYVSVMVERVVLRAKFGSYKFVNIDEKLWIVTFMEIFLD